MNRKKILKALVCGALSFSLLAGGLQVQAAPVEQTPNYKTVTEVFDWGPSVSKLPVNLGSKVSSKDINKDTFKVYVERKLSEGAKTFAEGLQIKQGNLSLGAEARDEKDLKGYREVVNAYVADENCNPVNSGNFVVIEMAVGPTVNLGAALNFDLITSFNTWVTSDYTITLNKNVGSLKSQNFVVDNSKGDIRPVTDKWTFNHYEYGDSRLSLAYASYEPKDNGKHPLIIWLHGMGEGGNDSPSLPIMGNKANYFADESIQKYFGGAYVVAPQARTFWMHGVKNFGDGTSIYRDSLMGLIKDYVKNHPNIDENKIYIGGDSNGGYMTVLMIRDYPEYFAAAFPTCEALANNLISDADIQALSRTPTWFIAAKTDTVVPPNDYVVPTVERLKKIGAPVHFSYLDNVVDQTGLYKKADGTPYEYMGHWVWIPLYNDEIEGVVDGKKMKLFEWLAQQNR